MYILSLPQHLHFLRFFSCIARHYPNSNFCNKTRIPYAHCDLSNSEKDSSKIHYKLHRVAKCFALFGEERIIA